MQPIPIAGAAGNGFWATKGNAQNFAGVQNLRAGFDSACAKGRRLVDYEVGAHMVELADTLL